MKRGVRSTVKDEIVDVAQELEPVERVTAVAPARSGRRLLLIVALGIVLTAAGVALVKGPWRGHLRAGDESPPSARGILVPRSPADDSAVAVCLGVVDARGGVVSLLPTVSGRVVAVLAEENASVRAGQPIVRLDDRIAQTQLREAEAGVQAAEAQLAEAKQAPEQHELSLAQARAALAAAQRELAAARLAAAHKRQLADAKQLGRAEAEAAAELVKKLEALEQAEKAKQAALALRDPSQELARAKAELAARVALRDRARETLAEFTLRAPSAGTVLRMLVSAGDLAGPHNRQAAVLFCPAGPRIVRAEVEQEFAGRVALGQAATIEDAARSGGPTWTGRVARIADWFTLRRIVTPDQVPVQEVRTLECLVELDPGQPPLRIGQRVRVRLHRENPTSEIRNPK